MAKGKFKAKAESQKATAAYEDLLKRLTELTAENQLLREQADQDHLHHAFQIAQMHEQVESVTSERVKQLEEEVLMLKRALRGAV